MRGDFRFIVLTYTPPHTPRDKVIAVSLVTNVMYSVETQFHSSALILS